MDSPNLIMLIAAFALAGMFSFSANADPGNVEITDMEFQGGIGFDLLDPDGIKSVTQLAGEFCPEEVRVISDCSDPPTFVEFEFNTNHFCEDFNSETNENTGTFLITDCQADMSTETWVLTGTGSDGIATCTQNCDPPKPGVPVGGEFLQIETSSLLLAGIQSSAIWMLPVIAGAAGTGFAALKLRRK